MQNRQSFAKVANGICILKIFVLALFLEFCIRGNESNFLLNVCDNGNKKKLKLFGENKCYKCFSGYFVDSIAFKQCYKQNIIQK